MGIFTKDEEGNFLYFTPWQSCFVFTCGVGEKKAMLCSNTINQALASKSALNLMVCCSDLGADLCPWCCYRPFWNFPLVILASVRILPARESHSLIMSL